MCNCNNKRAAYTAQNNQLQTGMVKVKLVADVPMVLNGNITGRMYVFRNINDTNWVDQRDVLSMKQTAGLQIIY